MSDSVFENLVARDIRGLTSAEQQADLRHRDNLHRWFEELLRTRQSVEDNLAQRREEAHAFRAQCRRLAPERGKAQWESYRKEYGTWRKRTSKFLFHVKEKLMECARLMTGEVPDTQEAFLLWARALIPFVREGVTWHERYSEWTF